MHSRALKITFATLALGGALLVGCKKSTKGNVPITGQIPTTTTTSSTVPSSTTSTMPLGGGSTTTSMMAN
ncbi:MAG: hypothetical protein ACKOIA_11305 [Acidimicrobiia bacterium]